MSLLLPDVMAEKKMFLVLDENNVVSSAGMVWRIDWKVRISGAV